jgi:hypothetical protein
MTKKMTEEEKVGKSQTFVRTQGIKQVGPFEGLIDAAGHTRLFAELTADPDRPEARPAEAFQAILASCQPGWSIRILQMFWPAPQSREMFTRNLARWGVGGVQMDEGKRLLMEAFRLHVQMTPLPFSRRTILELDYRNEEHFSWWQSLPGMIAVFYVNFRPLPASEVILLARSILEPSFS